MAVEIEAQAVVPAARAAVYDATTQPLGLSRFFRGYPPLIPAIELATVDGDLRTVKMGDGTTILERIVELTPHSRHRYEMAEMNATQKLICTGMHGDWTFTDAPGGGTHIRWHYTIEPRPGLWRKPAVRVMAWALQRAMQRCLDNVVAAFR